MYCVTCNRHYCHTNSHGLACSVVPDLPFHTIHTVRTVHRTTTFPTLNSVWLWPWPFPSVRYSPYEYYSKVRRVLRYLEVLGLRCSEAIHVLQLLQTSFPSSSQPSSSIHLSLPLTSQLPHRCARPIELICNCPPSRLSPALSNCPVLRPRRERKSLSPANLDHAISSVFNGYVRSLEISNSIHITYPVSDSFGCKLLPRYFCRLLVARQTRPPGCLTDSPNPHSKTWTFPTSVQIFHLSHRSQVLTSCFFGHSDSCDLAR